MKSHASDLLGLVDRVYIDAATMCADNVLDVRDLETMRSRVKHEGLSFLTITLPSLGQDFERSLDQGFIGPSHFRSFKKRLKAPAFLRGFFDRVFDRETGRILHEPCIRAIAGVRQIAYVTKKLAVPCSTRRVNSALAKFTKIEQSFDEFDSALGADISNSFINVSKCLWTDVLYNGGKTIDIFATVPKHGPGATAEKLSGNAKYSCDRWHDRLEPYFPLLDTWFASATAYSSEEFKAIKVIPEEEEQPVRVIPVPKTLKGPRIIAIEPVCVQYAQQAISGALVELLESHRLTKGHVNFTDQTINRQHAINSSATGKSATLDLSAASDRVPYSLAIRMFDSHPDLSGAISACRSKRAQMPDGSIIELKKFASMGSALCFPVEAMYFYTICIAARLDYHNLPVTPRNIYKMSRGVFVYGDDLVVPTDESAVIIETLHKYCCKVNAAKSFWIGKFRESCGMDAYDGVPVTPVYLRQELPDNKRSVHSIVSSVDTCNQFYKAGYWNTADYMRMHIENIIGKLPIVSENCGGLGWNSYQPFVSYQRWGTKYHRPEVKTLVASAVYCKSRLTSYSALSKCLIRGGSPLPFHDEKHLLRSARHGAVTLKRRWTSPF